MKEITVTGKTVEEAVKKALTELNVPRDRVKVTVINDAKKGFLGIGSKPASVKISKLPDPIHKAESYLQAIIEKMGINVKIEKREEDENILFELVSDKVAVLIGKRGQTLNALQYLTNLVANRYTSDHVRIQIDAEDYRKRREITLQQLAKRQAEKALKLKRKVALDPMPGGERKIVHLILKDMDQISTESEGEGTNRHVVIIPSNHTR